MRSDGQGEEQKDVCLQTRNPQESLVFTNLFLQFCMVYGLDPDAPSCDDLAAYTEWLLQGGLAVSTVRNHMAAVKALYLWMDNSVVLKILNSSTWTLTTRGLLNSIRPSYNTRAAMKPDDLLALMEVAYTYDELNPLTVALSFGFFAYLRISNLAPQSAASFDPTRNTFGDILLRANGLIFALKWSKTRQNENTRCYIPLPNLGTSWLCPFKAWRLYNVGLRETDTTPLTPLLVTSHEKVASVVTTSMLRSMFRKAVAIADLKDQGYTPHSLRRGGATFSYHAGVPLEQIKRHGTWKSQAVHRYLMDFATEDTPVANSFQKLLVDYTW